MQTRTFARILLQCNMNQYTHKCITGVRLTAPQVRRLIVGAEHDRRGGAEAYVREVVDQCKGSARHVHVCERARVARLVFIEAAAQPAVPSDTPISCSARKVYKLAVLQIDRLLVLLLLQEYLVCAGFRYPNLHRYRNVSASLQNAPYTIRNYLSERICVQIYIRAHIPVAYAAY